MVKKSYRIEIVISNNENTFTKILDLKNSKIGQLHLIIINDFFDITKLQTTYKISLIHDLDLFPRFYVGILKLDCVPTLTHTFFDTSNCEKNKTPCNTSKLKKLILSSDHYFDSAVSIPILKYKDFHTEIKTYAQNLYFKGEIFLGIFNYSGELFVLDTLPMKKF